MPCSRTRVPRRSSVSPSMSGAGPESVGPADARRPGTPLPSGRDLTGAGTSASFLQFQARRTKRTRVACGRRELAAATPTPLLRHTPFQPVKVPVALAHVASRRSPGASGQAPSRSSGNRAGPPARGHGCRMRAAFQPMATPPDDSAVSVPTPLSRARVPVEAGRRRGRRGSSAGSTPSGTRHSPPGRVQGRFATGRTRSRPSPESAPARARVPLAG